jgi:hypothetical protein
MSTTAVAAALMMAYAGAPPPLPVLAFESVQLAQAVEPQTRFYGPDGRSLGTAAPQGDGTVKFRDAQGRSVGSATTDQSGTTRYYSPDGRSLGTSTGSARTPFPDQRR